MTNRPQDVQAAIEHFNHHMPYFPLELKTHLRPLLGYITQLESAAPKLPNGVWVHVSQIEIAAQEMVEQLQTIISRCDNISKIPDATPRWLPIADCPDKGGIWLLYCPLYSEETQIVAGVPDWVPAATHYMERPVAPVADATGGR